MQAPLPSLVPPYKLQDFTEPAQRADVFRTRNGHAQGSYSPGTLCTLFYPHSSLHTSRRTSRSQHEEQMSSGCKTAMHKAHTHLEPFAPCFYNFVITGNKEPSATHSSIPTTVPAPFTPDPAAQTQAHNPRLQSLTHVWCAQLKPLASVANK
jgi:hypothetical protein